MTRPAFPAPSDLWGMNGQVKLARMRGEIAELCLQRAVVPAQAGTQYSRDASNEPRSRGVLDPRFRGDDSEGLFEN